MKTLELDIFGIRRRRKGVERVSQVLNVLLKYGFDFAIKEMGLYPRIPFRKKYFAKPPEEAVPYPVAFRKILEELGPTYVKFGQILSTRSDILPKKYIDELKKLQDNVPPFPFENVQEMIKTELGSPAQEIFESIDSKPFASASLAQVHLARLKTGESVVVKVQRPNISRVIEADIDVLHYFASVAERRFPDIRNYHPVGLVEEFAKTIRREQDFFREARNAQKFKRNFQGWDRVYVPEIFWDYSSKRVLTLEYIKGVKVDDFKKLDEMGIDRGEIAREGTKAFMKMIYEDGFFQADPHPGNLIIMEGGVIGFVDFGMMGRVDKKLKERITDLGIAVYKADMDLIAKRFTEIGAVTEKTDIEQFKFDIADIIDQYYNVPLKQINVASFLNDILAVALENSIRFPPNFSYLIKTMATIEGIGSDLDPDFNLAEVSEPFLDKIIKERMNPIKAAGDVMQDATLLGGSLYNIPVKLDSILGMLQKGVVSLEHRGFEKLISEMDSASNRVSFSMVISSIIIGSSLVMLTDKGPQVFGFPFFGILGFAFASLLGTVLLVSILRSGKF